MIIIRKYKYLIFTCLLVMVIFYTGCNKDISKNIISSSISSDDEELEKITVQQNNITDLTIKPEYLESISLGQTNLTEKQSSMIDIISFDENKIIYSEALTKKEEGNYESSDVVFYEYNIAEKSSQKLFSHDSYGIVASDHILLSNKNEKNVVFAYADLSDKLKIFIGDINNHTVQNVNTNQPIFKIDVFPMSEDSDQFVLFKVTQSEPIFTYTVSVYNIKTKFEQNIMEKTYNQSLQEGEAVPYINVINNRIYVYYTKFKNDEKEYHMEQYDIDGNLLDDSLLSFMPELLNEAKKVIGAPPDPNWIELVNKFNIIDNYFQFTTQSGASAIIEDYMNEPKVILNNIRYVNLIKPSSYMSYEDVELIPFSRYDDKKDIYTLMVLDKKKNKLYNIDLGLENYNSLNYFANKSGDIIIAEYIRRTESKPEERKFFILKHENIEKMIS